MRKLTMGLVLALFLVVTPAAVAAEGMPTVFLPSSDLATQVLDWLGLSETAEVAAMGPGLEPNALGDVPPLSEIGPSIDPGDLDEPPEAELGPILEPNG